MDRLKEPSTWAGLAVLASLFGHPLPADLVSAIPTVVAGLGGLFAVVKREGK